MYRFTQEERKAHKELMKQLFEGHYMVKPNPVLKVIEKRKQQENTNEVVQAHDNRNG
jgi:hypothetical protein